MDVGGMAMAGHKEEGGSKCTGTSCLDTQHPRKRTPDPADPNNHLGRPGGANLWSYYSLHCSIIQGGITCGAIDEPRKSSEAIDKRVIIDFRDKNVVIARFRDINEVFI